MERMRLGGELLANGGGGAATISSTADDGLLEKEKEEGEEKKHFRLFMSNFIVILVKILFFISCPIVGCHLCTLEYLCNIFVPWSTLMYHFLAFTLFILLQFTTLSLSWIIDVDDVQLVN